MNTWIEVARIDEIPDGYRKCVQVKDHFILLFHVEETYWAIENRCSHLDLLMSDGTLEKGVYFCPWHGAAFDIASGKSLGPPAKGDIKTFPVRIKNDIIQIEIGSS